MEPLKEINFIVIHHSQREIDSPRQIRKRHLERGWEDIGYHYLIGKKGKLYRGRSIRFIGAHVLGYNKNSIGICLIGDLDKSIPTRKQLKSLIKFLGKISKKYKIPIENILGHREFPNVTKTCPGNFGKINKNLILKNYSFLLKK